MEGIGIKAERETTITFNEEDDTASIWTASETVYRRLLKQLGTDYLWEDGERHAVFRFPKQLLRLPKVKSAARIAAGQRLSRAKRAKSADLKA